MTKGYKIEHRKVIDPQRITVSNYTYLNEVVLWGYNILRTPSDIGVWNITPKTI